MAKKLFLLDGMALVYRSHFALINRPIFTSKGVNTSALYGFTQTLLDILKNQQPTHIAVAFDTDVPTHRHKEFAEYKSQREAMPEDLSQALPHVRRMIEAFNIPVLTCDGWEADDIIGTLVSRAEKHGFVSYMVTPDKDFGQLVSGNTYLYKPSRMGDAVEVLGLPEILKRWGVERPEQVMDVMGLWGDTSDNIPGVPGIGEKTAIKLIGQYRSIENLLAHTDELKGKLKETMETHRKQALLSKRLATILCDAPCKIELEQLKIREPNNEELKRLFVEFEFNSIGRRLFGDNFKAGRGYEPAVPPPVPKSIGGKAPASTTLALVGETQAPADAGSAPIRAELKTLAEVKHDYLEMSLPEAREKLIELLNQQKSFCFSTETTSSDSKQATLIGLAFTVAPHTGYYVPMPDDAEEATRVLGAFRPVLEDQGIEKVGHDLKFDFSVLKWHGISVRGKLFDTMLAHSLIEPDLRHSLDHLAEAHLGYTRLSLSKLIGEKTSEQISLKDLPRERLVEYAVESVDVAWQLREILEPMLKAKGQERVFYEIEAPLLPVLVDMEFDGIRLDAPALANFAAQLTKDMIALERTICRLAGKEFNLNSPKQLGETLFDCLKITDSPKKTKTGQYATDEQTLLSLAPDHEIVQRLLEYREMSKLKSTYVDTLPAAIWSKTGRVHTTYNQVATSTGRLNSQDPNLQNIPIRRAQGKEIRKAFVARNEEYVLLSADYSQIELRIIASLSREQGLLEAFSAGIDIHTATAARVFGVALDQVEAEMRRKAKMVNYGIAYGISAFGLAQRLGIARKEAVAIIDQYFAQFPGIRNYMSETIAFAQERGYVETVTGRRRYLRDIRSSNATTRNAAERNAINAPIQGSAADMIKIAMTNIHRELDFRKMKTRMLLQVHDVLVFDLYAPEEKEVLPMIEEKMKTAIPLDVPIEVEMGMGRNWLEAH
jgi:DNA polymerase-1